MSNSYYTPPTDVAALTRARSGDINLRDDAVDAAFDKVPAEEKLKRGTVNYAVTTGAADAYIVALPYVPSGYVDGLLVNAYIHATNTGASTVNVNSLGVKSIKLHGGGTPVAGDLQKFVDLRYSTTTGFFHVQGNTAGSVADAAASAAAAAASASAASSSAASAAASYDSFDDRYLGPKASDPTLDNDGNALLTGALYFNTTVNIMRIYTGSAWLASTASAANVAFTPAGTIAATNVQAAIEELGTEKAQLTDLAASSGAGLMGWIRSAIGAVAQRVSDKLSDHYNAFDHFTAAEKADALTGAPAIDTTANIQAASDGAFLAGQKWVAYGTFRISGKIVIKGDADLSQATFLVYGTPAVAFEISTGSATNPVDRITNKTILMPKRIENKTKPGGGWAGQGIGVRVVNANSCTVFFGNEVGFAIGRLFTAYDVGNVYNTYHMGHAENNQINIDLNPGNAAAWVNENVFIGGRNSHYSAEGTNVAGTRHIRIAKATSVTNNNLFIKPSIEGDVAEYHVENGGASNTISQARWEAATPKVLYTSDNANQAARNLILAGYGAQNIVYTYVGSGGTSNAAVFPGGSFESIASVKSYQQQGSSANPVHQYHAAGTRPETAGAAVWTMQHSAQFLKGKAPADAYERVKLDYVNGRLYAGSGTAAPTTYIKGTATGLEIQASAYVAALTDNAVSSGLGSLRWSVIYAGTGTINTSDEREKQQISPVNVAALRAWAKVNYCQFKFNDAVADKGTGARWHFGVIAQRVKEAFEAEGLDPFAYGILCYDEWTERPEERGEDGIVTHPYRAAGNRYGIRYEEALALECAYLRSRLN